MRERVWLLDLDVERELASGAAHDVFAATERRRELVSALAMLTGGDPVLARRTRVSGSPLGFCWCPSRSALAALAEAGARPPVAPSQEVLRAVNDRRFSAGLGLHFQGARFATDATEALRRLDEPSDTGAWLVRKPFGFAGRGRLVVTALDERARSFVARSVFEGGVLIEPCVVPLLDVSLHGFLDRKGRLTLGRATVQEMGAGGVWRGSHLASNELTHDELRSLETEAIRSAEALCASGYFGPFGVDAFRYQGGFQPRSEINARYTMGWAIGMASRPDLDEPPG